MGTFYSDPQELQQHFDSDADRIRSYTYVNERDEKSLLSVRVKSALHPPADLIGINKSGWGIWSMKAQFWLDLFGLWGIVQRCIVADDNDDPDFFHDMDSDRDQRLLHGSARLVLAKLAGDEDNTMVFRSKTVGIAWKRLEIKHVPITQKAIEKLRGTAYYEVL